MNIFLSESRGKHINISASSPIMPKVAQNIPYTKGLIERIREMEKKLDESDLTYYHSVQDPFEKDFKERNNELNAKILHIDKVVSEFENDTRMMLQNARNFIRKSIASPKYFNDFVSINEEHKKTRSLKNKVVVQSLRQSQMIKEQMNSLLQLFKNTSFIDSSKEVYLIRFEQIVKTQNEIIEHFRRIKSACDENKC